MKCLHCGDCCKRMSPIANPCPYITSRNDFIFCDQYERRPYECIQHTFAGAEFCPIGLDVLNLRHPRDVELINKRVDEGHEMIQKLNCIGSRTLESYM